ALYDDASSTTKELDDIGAGEAWLRSASGSAVPATPSGPVSVAAGVGALQRYRQGAMGLALSDALCVVIALLASYALRYPGSLLPAREAAVIALAPLVWIVVFYTFDLYSPQHVSAPEELR